MSWTLKRTANDGTIGFQAIYRDPSGKKRSAGTFPSRRQATAEGRRAESRVESGLWIDRTSGRTTFNDYVEKVWWPSRQLEVSTRAGYRSYLDKHFLPFFGDIPMAEILPSTVQAWITKAVGAGLSSRSVVKYHVMLHGIFKRAVRDRVIAYNPCADSELPKVITKKQRILAPAEFERLLACIPARFTALVVTEIETGLRWGELIALRPRHIDFLRRTITVEDTIVEVSKKLWSVTEAPRAGCSPADNPAGRSVPPGSANGSTNSACGPAKLAPLPCSASPPDSPLPCSPDCSESASASPSRGNAPPPETGPTTPPTTAAAATRTTSPNLRTMSFRDFVTGIPRVPIAHSARRRTRRHDPQTESDRPHPTDRLTTGPIPTP